MMLLVVWVKKSVLLMLISVVAVTVQNVNDVVPWVHGIGGDQDANVVVLIVAGHRRRILVAMISLGRLANSYTSSSLLKRQN